MSRRIRNLLWLVLSATPLSAAADTVADFHPLTPGARWHYAVTEADRDLTQSIGVEAGSGPRESVLVADTGLRHTRYRVSARDGAFCLDEVRGRWGIIPFWRTHRFDPPLPFLRLADTPLWHWSWRGTARWQGHEVVAVEFDGRREDVGPDGTAGPGRWIVVEAEFRTRTGESLRYEAWYEKHVGLVRQVAADYDKRLESYVAP